MNSPTTSKRAFAKRLREMRERKGWTQAELARHMGVRKATASAWEVGKAVPPYEHLFDLAAALEGSYHYLVGGLGGPRRVSDPFQVVGTAGAPVSVAPWQEHLTGRLAEPIGPSYEADEFDRKAMIEDDSMTPELKAHDIVIYREVSQQRPVPGNYVMARNRVTGEHFCRQYRRVRRPGVTYELVSFNDLYPTEEESEEIELVGVVTELKSRLLAVIQH
jgi:transcriptional regulator with XRE-family HTH domain